MTPYTVVWPKGSEADLAAIWLAAPDRQAVTEAAQAIDRALGEDAGIKGFELSEGLRVLYEPPLRVLFVVREKDRIVEVLRVKCG